jgi:hypothetical protein
LIPIIPRKDASEMLRHILAARDRLNLPPDDPFGAVIERRMAEETSDEGKDAAELRAARIRLDAKADEVRRAKGDVDRQRQALHRREAELAKRAESPAAAPVPKGVDEEEVREMRIKLAQLKTALHERSTERITLRRELEKANDDLQALREGASAPKPAGDAAPDEEAAHYLPEELAGNQPLRLVEYPAKFRETLESLPRQVARAALALLGRLAGGEPAAFTGLVQLKACLGIFRLRIGIDHRLLFRLTGDRVQVVDLINRRDLERKIKTLRAGG